MSKIKKIVEFLEKKNIIDYAVIGNDYVMLKRSIISYKITHKDILIFVNNQRSKDLKLLSDQSMPLGLFTKIMDIKTELIRQYKNRVKS